MIIMPIKLHTPEEWQVTSVIKQKSRCGVQRGRSTGTEYQKSARENYSHSSMRLEPDKNIRGTSNMPDYTGGIYLVI